MELKQSLTTDYIEVTAQLKIERIEGLRDFYSKLEETVVEANNDILLMAYLNVRVGNQVGRYAPTIGEYGEATLTRNGRKLLEVYMEHESIIICAKFKHKNIYEFTECV